jgi:hypothetical protein
MDKGEQKGSKQYTEEDDISRRIKNYGLAQEEDHSWLEFRAPLIVLGVGLVGLFVAAIAFAGTAGFRWATAYVLAVLFIQVPLTIVGMYVLGAVLGISYGLLKSAILKLAAIMVLVAAISFGGLATGYLGFARLILVPIASWTLFSTFFDLDVRDTVASAVGLWLLSLGLGVLLVLVLG